MEESKKYKYKCFLYGKQFLDGKQFLRLAVLGHLSCNLLTNIFYLFNTCMLLKWASQVVLVVTNPPAKVEEET